MKRLLVAPLVLAVIFAGISGLQAVQTEPPMFSAARSDAEIASIHIDVPFEKAFVRVLKTSDALIEANTQHIGEMNFSTEDGVTYLREKLQERPTQADPNMRWDVWLNPRVPLDLALHVDFGSATLDASSLTLAELDVSVESGQMEADLPVMELPIPIEARVSSGAMTINVPKNGGANFKVLEVYSGYMRLNLGADVESSLNAVRILSGTLRMDIPAEAAVRVEIQHVGAGMVNMEHALVRISGTDAEEGIWETYDFANAEHQIYIVIESIDAGMFELR
jgi:hypothetical protein